MKWKWKLVIAIILDLIDLILGLGGLALNYIIPGIAVIINNIRGIIWDVIVTPILIYLFGLSGLIYLTEIVIPEEVDMFLPLATIIALINKDKK